MIALVSFITAGLIIIPVSLFLSFLAFLTGCFNSLLLWCFWPSPEATELTSVTPQKWKTIFKEPLTLSFLGLASLFVLLAVVFWMQVAGMFTVAFFSGLEF